MARILITSALPYINGVKHLGNLVGSQLPSDAYEDRLDAFLSTSRELAEGVQTEELKDQWSSLNDELSSLVRRVKRAEEPDSALELLEELDALAERDILR